MKFLRFTFVVLLVLFSTLSFGNQKTITLLECVDSKGYTNYDEVINLTLDCQELGIINSLEGVKKLKNLSRFYMHDNNISDITLIAQHFSRRNIFWFYFGNNPVANYNPLGLMNYYYLDLPDKNITDISFMSSIHNLRELNISGNNVSNINPLLNLDYLEKIIAYGNNISCSDIDLLINKGIEVLYDYCDSPDNISPTLELISIGGLKRGSIPTTNVLSLTFKTTGYVEKIKVDWLGNGYATSTISLLTSDIVTLEFIYTDKFLEGYFDKNIGFSKRLVTATAIAYGKNEKTESKSLSGSFTIYNYREWMNSTISAPKVVEDGVEMGVYVSLGDTIDVETEETNLVFRLQGDETWSNKVPFSRVDGKEYYFHLPNTTGLNDTFEYKVQTISSDVFSVPATENWSDIKEVTFPESFAESLDRHIMDVEVELSEEEKELLDYLTLDNTVKFLRTDLKVEVLKAIVKNTTNIDVDLLEYEIQLAVSQLNLGEKEAREVTSLIIDLVPYIGTGKAVGQLTIGRDLLTYEEVNRWFEGISISADVVSFGAGGRIIKVIKKSDKVAELSQLFPKIVHNIKLNRAKALSVPYKFVAKWGGISYYKHGGNITAIQHIVYKHSFDSVLAGSKFAENISINEIYSYVDDALKYGQLNHKGNIVYNTGKIIGIDNNGLPYSIITLGIQNGNIRTAFPIGIEDFY